MPQSDIIDTVTSNLWRRQSDFFNNSTSESTANTSYSTTPNRPNRPDSFRYNFGIVVIFVGGIVIIFTVLRLSILICSPSRSTNTSSTNQTPNYYDAIVNVDSDGTKLPSYDELQNQQRIRTPDSAST